MAKERAIKPPRNEPCPCGSGLKYKKCCLKNEHGDNAEAKFRELEASLMERMMTHADTHFGETAIERAWFVFLDELTVVPFDPEDPLNLLFVPWYLFNWTVDEPDAEGLLTAPLHETIAESFLKQHKSTLSADEIAILKASNRRPFSFCEIEQAVPGESLKLFDILREQSFEVFENTASRTLKVGEIIVCATMLPIDGRLRQLALGPFAIPAENRDDVIELRNEILERQACKVIDEKILHLEDPFVIGLYLDLLDEILEEEDDDFDSSDDERH